MMDGSLVERREVLVGNTVLLGVEVEQASRQVSERVPQLPVRFGCLLCCQRDRIADGERCDAIVLCADARQ